MRRNDRLVAAKAVLARFMICLSLGACTGMNQTAALSQADRQLMDKTAQQSLEIDKVGQSRTWDNPNNDHVGTITPLRTFTNIAGRPCRDYQQTATAAGVTLLALDTACRQPTGGWNSVNFGGLAGFNSYRPYDPALGPAYSRRHYGYARYGPGHDHHPFYLGYRQHHRGHGFSIGYSLHFGV